MSQAGFDDTEKQDAVVRDLANVDVIGEAVWSSDRDQAQSQAR
jgi:hypothetical protein